VDDGAQLKLSFRLVPADDRPADSVVLSDIVRLIQQAIATAPKDVPTVSVPDDGFREPGPDNGRSALSLKPRIESRIQQASAASQQIVEKRAQTLSQADGEQRLAEQSVAAAERVVSAVQGAIIRAVAVRVPAHEG
jgi:hypothetical protein